MHHNPFTMYHAPSTMHHAPSTMYHTPFPIAPMCPRNGNLEEVLGEFAVCQSPYRHYTDPVDDGDDNDNHSTDSDPVDDDDDNDDD